MADIATLTIWIIFALSGIAALFALAALLKLRASSDVRTSPSGPEQSVQHFVVRRSQAPGIKGTPVVILLIFFAVQILNAVPSIPMFSTILFFLLPVTPMLVFTTLCKILWELEVDGTEMRLRTFFRDATFSVHDISAVGIESRIKNEDVTVHGVTGRFFTITAQSVGYDLFMRYIESHNIPLSVVQSVDKLREAGWLKAKRFRTLEVLSIIIFLMWVTNIIPLREIVQVNPWDIALPTGLLVLVLLCANWLRPLIRLDDDGFTVSQFFWTLNRVKYAEITSLVVDHYAVRIVVADKTVDLYCWYYGPRLNAFVELLKEILPADMFQPSNASENKTGIDTAGAIELAEIMQFFQQHGTIMPNSEAGDVQAHENIDKIMNPSNIMQVLQPPIATAPKPKVKRTLSWVMFIIQLLLPLGFIALLVVATEMGAWFLDGAYTAQETLLGYFRWYRMIFWSSIVASTATILVNFLVVFWLKRAGKQALKNIITAVIGALLVIGIAVLLNVVDGNVPRLMQQTWEDLAAIENDELGETMLRISLTARNERPAELPGPLGERHPRSVYRAWLGGPPYTLNYPRGLSPSIIRESIRDEAYHPPGEHRDTRLIIVRYTPNFNMVVEVEPLRFGD